MLHSSPLAFVATATAAWSLSAALGEPARSAPIHQPLMLVDAGVPRAAIVVPDEPTECAAQAASVLQKVVEQMSGAMLPIQPEREFRGDRVAVLVGASQLATAMGASVEQDYALGDRYRIRTADGRLALVGNDDRLRGSIYAVYDLLERLGCGWYGPDPVWHVIPRRPTLAVEPIDADERPAFLMRDIWLVNRHAELRDAWRLGGQRLSHGHAYDALVPPAKYREAHPEWFGENQPCLTNPQVLALVVEQFRAALDSNPGAASFSLCANDAGGFCTCARCQAVGNASAQQLHFANGIARELAQTHPGRYLLSIYAYWYSHDPPQPLLAAEPGVVVILINEGDHTKALDEPDRPEVAAKGRSNAREVNAFAGWRQTGGLGGIYEWWIPGCSNEHWRRVPWHSGQTALRNLRYWRAGGIRYLTYETQYEDGDGFPIRWPLFYVGARGMWDPDLSSDQIMAEACARLYGPAGAEMHKFYQVLEQAMARTAESGGNWNLPAPQQIYTMPVEEAATAHLEAAARATTEPAIVARIEQDEAMWAKARAVLAALRAEDAKTAAPAGP